MNVVISYWMKFLLFYSYKKKMFKFLMDELKEYIKEK